MGLSGMNQTSHTPAAEAIPYRISSFYTAHTKLSGSLIPLLSISVDSSKCDVADAVPSTDNRIPHQLFDLETVRRNLK